ncbi:hypothetical protein GNY06_09825 [Elizabethkingia argentiflava]|uniref:NTF2-like N-terminal transpeptidase n=1 Tax=Elizabethkingia argenteiflava TaxID=2681556 RepID=A0A845PXU2_9FLAO|nr:hypothetical protein [Elizabethkingia argenteiflava]NAW51656.1 hypothetical protein [Elizabethkingia argenteiflava]
MRYFKYLFLLSFFMMISCKKSKVDGSSLRSFQRSINDMASNLNTIKQIKFNEALYIIKKFGTNTEGDINQMETAAQILNGKNVVQIFALADSIAQKHGIEWSSTTPPSLGGLDIFSDSKPTEIDPNDVKASALSLSIQPASVDSIIGPTALMIIPRLVDEKGDKIEFSNAALETIMEVSSGGTKISTSKNLMINNKFKGFYLKISNIPVDKLINNSIDVKVRVKTAKKTLQTTKTDISLNTKALKPIITGPSLASTTEIPSSSNEGAMVTADGTAVLTEDPKTTVSRFIGNISNKNLKAAYDMSNNPKWESYENFSNTNSGFGAVKSISIQSLNTISKTTDQANVEANYTVSDQAGHTTDLNVTYSLKASADGWKITGYKINTTK